MATKQSFDLEALLAPIPGEDPAGVPLPNDIRRKLEDLRREPDAFDLQAGAPDKRADWHGVIALAEQTLITTSKDLLVAVRLTEAIAKRDGFSGLAQGFQLLIKLVTDCWDRIHPKPDPGEDDSVRLGPFLWMNHSIKGAKFPVTVANLRLFHREDVIYSYVYLMESAKVSQREEFARAFDTLRNKDLEDFQQVAEAVRASRTALIELGQALDARFGENAPDFISEENPDNLGRVLMGVTREVDKLMKARGLDPSTGEPQAANSSADASSPEGDSQMSGINTKSREGLYRQIESIADSLSRLEPHSPIPFLLHRVVKLGSLSFPELMGEFVRDSSTIDEVNRLLGIPKEE